MRNLTPTMRQLIEVDPNDHATKRNILLMAFHQKL